MPGFPAAGACAAAVAATVAVTKAINECGRSIRILVQERGRHASSHAEPLPQCRERHLRNADKRITNLKGPERPETTCTRIGSVSPGPLPCASISHVAVQQSVDWCPTRQQRGRIWSTHRNKQRKEHDDGIVERIPLHPARRPLRVQTARPHTEQILRRSRSRSANACSSDIGG